MRNAGKTSLSSFTPQIIFATPKCALPFISLTYSYLIRDSIFALEAKQEEDERFLQAPQRYFIVSARSYYHENVL